MKSAASLLAELRVGYQDVEFPDWPNDAPTTTPGDLRAVMLDAGYTVDGVDVVVSSDSSTSIA